MNPAALSVPHQARWIAARLAGNVTDEQMPPEGRFSEPYLTARRAVFGHNGHATDVLREALVDHARAAEVVENILAAEPTPPEPPFALVNIAQMWQATKGVRHLWEGWIPAGQITLIGGVPNVGKSPLLLAIVAGYLKGVWPDGTPVPEWSRGRNVVYCLPEGYEEQTELLLAWGIDRDEAGKRIHIPALPMPGAPDEFVFAFKIDTSPGIDALRNTCELSKPGLIVIDGLRAAMSGDESSSGDIDKFAGPLVALARQHDAAIVMTHHLTKGAETASREGTVPSVDWFRGSSHLAAMPRAAWIVDQPNAANPEERRITLVKASSGPKGSTQGFQMAKPSDGIRWLSIAPQAAPRNKGEHAQRIILEMVMSADRTREDIDQEVERQLGEVSSTTIKNALADLTRSRQILSVRRKDRWLYTRPGPPAPQPPSGDEMFDNW